MLKLKKLKKKIRRYKKNPRAFSLRIQGFLLGYDKRDWNVYEKYGDARR